MELTKWSEALNNACKIIIDWLDLDWRDVESPRIAVGSGITIEIGPLVISEGINTYEVSYKTKSGLIHLNPVTDQFKFRRDNKSCMGSIIDLGAVINSGGLCSTIDEYLKIATDRNKVNDYIWDVKLVDYLRNLNWTKFKCDGIHKIFYKSYDVLAEYDLNKVTGRNPTDLNVVRFSGEVPVIKELFSDQVWLELKRLESNARIVGVSNCKKNKNGNKYAISVTILDWGEYTRLNGLTEIRKFNDSKKK